MNTWRSRGFAAAAIIVFQSTHAQAQWSADPAVNVAIGDKPGEQVQPKVKPTADGGCFISWFDNTAGGYDVYIQRLDRQGVEQTAHNGVLVADRSLSSTQDYGLAVDANDRALIGYRDDRFGGIQVGANLVSSSGQLLWGPNGVLVTNTAEFIGNIKVAATSDGNYVVAWTQGSNLRRQKLDPNGNVLWAAGGMFEAPPASNSDLICDAQASDNGGVIVSWSRNPSRFLHAQKYDASGAAVWNGGNPVVVFNGSSLQFGFFPAFVTDGAGGAVFGWYETGGTRNGYVQRVDAAGAEVFPQNGVACSTLTGSQGRISASVAYAVATNEIFLYWTEVSLPVQSLWGVYGQKFNGTTGARLWSDSAKVLVPMSGAQPSFVTGLADNSGNSMAFWFSQSGSSLLMGARLDTAGNLVWGGTPIQVASTLSGKTRLSAALSPCQQALITWSDARNDANDIYAQNLRQSGTGGNNIAGNVVAPTSVNVADLLAVIANWGSCSSSEGCAADIAPLDCPDGNINVADLLMVIFNWG